MKNKRKKLMKIKDTRPFAQKHPKWNTFFGFMLLIALMAGGYFLLRFLGRKLIDFINLFLLKIALMIFFYNSISLFQIIELK